MGNIIVGILVFGFLGITLYRMIKARTSGKGSCHSGCGSCPYSCEKRH